ncbi:MAG: hypothetical protein A3C44_02550 [Gammaproteobacteria bacterium RIFCSPHIGHO2_02_FULL_39_13]|nr:MAG: hypothetical protein A3C44_02550 [Gammaproteobacteria bacterium RIFCSPHIGHO2_02_FULL_39_13]OGT50148.1 MAG: hypothetical protein A3E53_01855 [Gammaproteobacteria bacterium RIFCSPHIGHO2_12_FULL_39_24]
MQFLWKKLSIMLLACVFSASVFANTENTNAKKQFIQHMVTQHHFSRAELDRLFASLHPDKKVVDSMTAPFEKQPWTYYHDFFLTPKRITLGAAYLKNHHHVLMQMQKKYGIPASIITAIIGVETEYGNHLGKYSVLRSLYTLGFYYPPREKFFRKELGQYLLLTRENHLNPQTIKGSYAGALGIPQFMPSSYRYYGVAYHKGEPVNLFEQNDAIASVANYFHKMGWKPNQPIVHQLNSKYSYVNKKIAKRIVLPMKDGKQYWATYRNFDVIMSYNHNIVYVMAVYQLSQAIEKQYALNQRRSSQY